MAINDNCRVFSYSVSKQKRVTLSTISVCLQRDFRMLLKKTIRAVIKSPDLYLKCIQKNVSENLGCKPNQYNRICFFAIQKSPAMKTEDFLYIHPHYLVYTTPTICIIVIHDNFRFFDRIEKSILPNT